MRNVAAIPFAHDQIEQGPIAPMASLPDRLARIARLARRLFGVQIARISLVDTELHLVESIEGMDDSTSSDLTFCEYTFFGDAIFAVSPKDADRRVATAAPVCTPDRIGFHAGSPIRAEDGSSIGAITVVDPEPRVMTKSDLDALHDLAVLVENEIRLGVALAIQRSLLEDVVAEQRRSQHDPLTGVLSREGILEAADEAVRRAAHQGRGCTLVIVDLDHFKDVNDTYGHACGDAVLRIATERIRTALRDDDLTGRIGGDEFLLVLDDCPSAELATLVLERLRTQVTASPLKTHKGLVPVSASLGACVIEPGRAFACDLAIERADEALYVSKRQGRNWVTVVTG